MSKPHQPSQWVEYRCRACDHAFAESLVGVVACPRCDSIDNHEQVGHTTGPRV